jgi:toxin CptA
MLERRIAVAPSVMLASALSALHLAAAGLLWIVPLPVPGRILLTGAVAVSLIYYMARDASLHTPHSIVALEIRDGAVSLQTRRGEWLDGELLGSSYVSPRFTIVNFRPHGRWVTRRVILVPDNVDSEDFRHLRTWLRWRGGDGVQTEDSGAVFGSAGTPKNLTK